MTDFTINESGREVSIESRQSPIHYFHACIFLDKKLAHIFEINIEESKRGKGFGIKVVNDFIELCKKYDVKRVTGIPEKPSIEFWKANKFNIVPRDQSSPHDKDLPYNRSLSPLMIKELSLDKKHMRLSKRDASREQGNGWWVSPDNHVYLLQKGTSHLQWLQSHENIILHNDHSLKPNDPDVFEKAFQKGWVRVRIEFANSDMSKLIASISAVDIDLISTLPEEIKDIIATATCLEFVDISQGATTRFTKDELLQKLHRQRLSSFLPIKTVISRLK